RHPRRAGTAGSQEPGHDADLHPRIDAAVARQLPQGPPPRLTPRSTAHRRSTTMPTRRLPASVLLAWLALIGSIHAQSVQWQTDYSKARQLAKEKGLPLLLNVGTPDCFWCKQLDTRTFKDAGVVRLLNERFVPLKVDATKSPYLVNALRIESYPTIVYGSSDGKILGYQEGFLEADALKEKLLNLLTSVGTPDWMSRDYAEAVKSLTSDPAKALTL